MQPGNASRKADSGPSCASLVANSTLDYGGSSTTYYEGYDGVDYEYETTTSYDLEYDY
jgi:hypothetical protein